MDNREEQKKGEEGVSKHRVVSDYLIMTSHWVRKRSTFIVENRLMIRERTWAEGSKPREAGQKASAKAEAVTFSRQTFRKRKGNDVCQCRT